MKPQPINPFKTKTQQLYSYTEVGTDSYYRNLTPRYCVWLNIVQYYMRNRDAYQFESATTC